jgi:hypothetical protein
MRLDVGTDACLRTAQDDARRLQPASAGGFSLRSTLVLIAAVLAVLLLGAVEVRFGIAPAEWNDISAM